MGGIVSRSQSVLPAADSEIAIVPASKVFLSVKTQPNLSQTNSEPHQSSSASAVKWKILPTGDEARRKIFEADGSKFSDPERLELRMMLDEPISQRALANFAKAQVQLEILMCWVDTKEFRAIPTQDYRRSKALHIYHKYIKSAAVLEIGGVDPEEKQNVFQLIERSKADPAVLTEDLFEKVQSVCFNEIYNNIYRPFKLTEAFHQLLLELQSHYNSVRVTDFEYMNKLGEGGFGFVVHCKKKSTGQVTYVIL